MPFIQPSCLYDCLSLCLSLGFSRLSVCLSPLSIPLFLFALPLPFLFLFSCACPFHSSPLSSSFLFHSHSPSSFPSPPPPPPSTSHLSLSFLLSSSTPVYQVLVYHIQPSDPHVTSVTDLLTQAACSTPSQTSNHNIHNSCLCCTNQSPQWILLHYGKWGEKWTLIHIVEKKSPNISEAKATCRKAVICR